MSTRDMCYMQQAGRGPVAAPPAPHSPALLQPLRKLATQLSSPRPQLGRRHRRSPAPGQPAWPPPGPAAPLRLPLPRRSSARLAAVLQGVEPLRASCSSMRKPGNAVDRPAPSFLTQEQREALDAALSKKRAEQREHL